VIPAPAYPIGTGPYIKLDDTHANVHGIDRGYEGFSILLEADGYQLGSIPDADGWTPACPLEWSTPCDPGCPYCSHLANTEILVIVNATALVSLEEAAYLAGWVAAGHGLMLIVDHCPYVGWISELSNQFGVAPGEWHHAITPTNGNFAGFFCRGAACSVQDEGQLAHNELTQGRMCGEAVQRVQYLQGSSISDAAGTVLTFPSCAQDGLCASIAGYSAGLQRNHGAGRVYIGTEAAMYTAQLRPTGPYGMQPSPAHQNEQYLRNVVHWLDQILPGPCPTVQACGGSCSVNPSGCRFRNTCQLSCIQADGTTFSCPPGQTVRIRNCGCLPVGSVCAQHQDYACQ